MVGGRTRRATMDPLLQEDIPDDPVHRQCNNNNDNKNNRFLYNNVILFLIRSKGVPKITCRERARPSYGPLFQEGSMRTPIRIATVLWRMKWYNNGHLFKAFTDTHIHTQTDIVVILLLLLYYIFVNAFLSGAHPVYGLVITLQAVTSVSTHTIHTWGTGARVNNEYINTCKQWFSITHGLQLPRAPQTVPWETQSPERTVKNWSL